MPLSKYQIRNEYSLADPDLYKVADKDDPEALLEGVAMAGFVGVLRQLGDLAEFAAEIFHDLHEEVMATAARGHGLIVRVQQLEAEFPLVERILLSQTIHTAFLYNSGTEWHPNARLDENLVTKGDLPRFVMDSYEECRGPPRLFLLDKFDVAGAGSCLKRFTDPSFFKAEATSSSDKRSDGQREKRTRKGRRRGLRWRNGEVPESFPSSHAKLHQLFLEELVETGGNDPDRRVKLKKRQFTGSLFDQAKRKSYMEKFVDYCSPEQKIVHEICIDALPLPWRSDDGCESGLEIVEIGTVSPLKESMHSSADTREMVVKPSLEGFTKGELIGVVGNETAQDILNLNDEIPSAIHKVKSEEAFSNRHSKSVVSDDDGHYSDDVPSEIDKYMDALAIMESEGETDSEYNKNPLYMNLKPIVVDSDASENLREPHISLLDVQSLGNSSASEDCIKFYRERQSSSCSISENSLAETTPYLNATVPLIAASNSDADNSYFQHHYTSEDASEYKTGVNSLAEASLCLDAMGSTVPSFSASNPNADSISSEHLSTFDYVPESKTDECTKSSTVAMEADEVTKSLQEFEENSINTSHLMDSSTTIHSVIMEASQKDYSLPSLGLYNVCSNSAEPDILSERSDPRHGNQTTNCSFSGSVLDEPERVDTGHWFSARKPIHGVASCRSSSSSVFSETSPDLGSTLDLLQIKPDKSDLSSSSVEHNDFAVGRVAAIIDSIFPETVESTDSDPNFEVCIASTEQNSDDQYSASCSKQKFNNQEQSETIPLGLMPLADYGDSSNKEVFAKVEDEETTSSTPIFGQTETLPLLVSSGPKTCVSDDAAEKTEYSSLEEVAACVVSCGDESNSGLSSGSRSGEMISGFVMKPFPGLHSSETYNQILKLPSETIDAALLEYPLAETGENNTGDKTGEDQNSVSSIGRECKAGLNVVAFNRDAIGGEITSVYSNQPDSVEAVEHLDKTETQEIQVDATNGNNKFDDNSEAFCVDKFPSEARSKHADISSSILRVQSDSDLHHVMGMVEHKNNGIDASRKVDNEGIVDENSCPSSSFPFIEKVVGQSVSVTKDYHQYEEELTICPSADIVAQDHIDPDQDAAVNSQNNICSMSYGYPDLISFNDSLDEIQSSSLQDQFTSERGSQNLESATCCLVGSPSHNLSEKMIPRAKGLGLHDDESQVKPLPVDREGCSSLNDCDQPSIQDLSAQPVVLVSGSSTEPMLESTLFFPSENMISGTNKATQMDGGLGQPIQTPGFPVLDVLPAEPQINLDSPPLPPLPPMQWRLSRFQNSSAATERVQPMILSMNSNEYDMSTHTSNGAEKLGYSNDLAQQDPDSEFSLENNIDGIEGEDLSLSTQTSMWPQNSIHILEEPYQSSAIIAEPELLVQGHASGNDSPMRETNVDAENDVQTVQLEVNPQAKEQALVDSHVHFLSSSSVHYDLQAPPGLMAPEARRTWSSAYDGMPTDAGFYANGALQKKLPRPRNPLIDEVVAIDKNKLRKVERVKPSKDIKPEERESFLEQLQLRKVVRVRAPMESKAQEGELLMEHLQLRKFRESVKEPVEPKSEDREFSLQQLQLRKIGESLKHQPELKIEEKESPLEQVQLRKVREKAKLEVEDKPEDTKSLRVQLRKVSERIKPEAKQKHGETESPTVQLRKVNESVQPEVELKPEETNSSRVQLRKVSERIKSEAQQKIEETESPRVQLRRVGQTEPLAGAPKIDERDSILEQIRNQSFSLKPAVASRPNIQGPRTNLKVAAILEKASTIRQAMAGSDEEEDADSWSDC